MGTTLSKKGTMRMRGEKKKEFLFQTREKQEIFTKRGKSSNRVKRGKHAPNANCSKTGSNCQEQENTQFWKGR